MATPLEKRSLVKDTGKGIVLTTPGAFLLPKMAYIFPSIEAAERGLDRKEKGTRRIFYGSTILAYAGLIPSLIGVIGSGLLDLSAIHGQGFEHFFQLPFPGNNLEIAGGISTVIIGTLSGLVALRENSRAFEQYAAVEDFKQSQQNLPTQSS